MADAPMSIPEILAAMQALLDSVNASAGTAPGDNAPLSEDQANRYEELEGMLKTAQRSDEIQKRNAAYRVNVTSLPVAVGAQKNEDLHTRAFMSYLRTAEASPELVQYRAQSEGIGSAGGFLVPEGFRNQLIERLKAYEGFSTFAQQLTTDSGNPLPYPTVDDTANSGEIVAEGSTFAAGADVVFGTRTLGAYKFMSGGANNLPIKVSYEMLQDSAIDISGYLTKAMAMRIGRKLATQFASGTGVNEIQGILSVQGGLSSGLTIASNAVGPTYLELLTWIHSLDPAYRNNAKFVFNDAMLAKVQALVDTTGRPLLWNYGQGNLESPAGGYTLLGYPVVIDQNFPTAGATASNLWGFFGDIEQTYVVRKVKDIALVTLNELYAPNGQVGYFSWMRADGMVQDVNAGKLATSA